MVRLSDLHEDDRKNLLGKACPAFDTEPWVTPPAPQAARVAIVTTAGLQVRGDEAFAIETADYRVIPGDVDGADLLMTHSSVNFDRSGFQADPNVVFPLDRLREMADRGEIGSVARYHYSFMGAYIDPLAFEPSGRAVARLLAGDAVDVALLVPV